MNLRQTWNRREFLLNTACTGVLLSGCAKTIPTPPPTDLPDLTVDIHAHVFNVSDVSLPGFIDQVFLRDPETEVGDKSFTGALIRLLLDIMLGAVTSASDEARRLGSLRKLPMTSPEAIATKDENVIAAGVEKLEERVQASSLRVSSLSLDELQADADLLSQLRFEAGVREPSTFAERGGSTANSIAAAVVSGRRSIISPFSRVGSGGFDLFATLRWAALLMRDRSEILTRLIDLYGGSNPNEGVRIYSPSIVDFDLWFVEKPQSNFSSLDDQIEVMSLLAKLDSSAIILNFAPFCPLRAAMERSQGNTDPLARLRRAVEQQGYVGVKLYPPMGFRPLGNDRSSKLIGQKLEATGAQIDGELRNLYSWCEENGVPIKSHGTNSLAAEVCSGQNANPSFWGMVVKEFPNLRVNIAHFGGFDELPEVDSETGCAEALPSYEARATALMSEDAHVYVDLGYWTETDGAGLAEVLPKINYLLSSNEILGERIMYGSDFSMIGREPGHEDYLVDVKRAVSGFGNGDLVDRIMSLNALEYLGLADPGSSTRRRLSEFFPEGHLYHQYFG